MVGMQEFRRLFPGREVPSEYSWRDCDFGDLPCWKAYGNGWGTLCKIAKEHEIELITINRHAFTPNGLRIAVSVWGSRSVKLTEGFRVLVEEKREPWLTIFKEFEEIVGEQQYLPK